MPVVMHQMPISTNEGFSVVLRRKEWTFENNENSERAKKTQILLA
jgi:hypothetical protein